MENLQKKKRKLSKNSVDTIPDDLLMDIFSRVPSKSIAKFRCVSKLWRSILGRPYFTDLYLSRTFTRPRLFFTLQVDKKLFFYSSAQPQNPDGIKSSVVATRFKLEPTNFDLDICTTLCGLVFRQVLATRKVRVICNLATGESINIPKVEKRIERNFYGYDPVNKQFKVLCMTSSHVRVLTLKTEKPLWRMIECAPHYPLRGHICINGVLYYPAEIKTSNVIVCFDVRSEKFSFVNIEINMLPQWFQQTLISYKGKLGVMYINENDETLVLWVLEDAGSHKWSSHIYALSPSWKEIAYGLKIVGMTSCTGEIVLTPYCLSNPFYVFFYNFERKTFARVCIEGFEEFKSGIVVNTFLDYVENIQGLRI